MSGRRVGVQHCISCQRRVTRCYYCSTISTCVFFFSPLFRSHWTPAEALEQAYVQVDPFYSTAKSLIMPYVARGSRFSVRTQRPSLLMVCIMFGLRFSSRLNTNTAVKWIIHSSGESISEQQLLPARRQAFPPLPVVKWFLALP